MDTRPFRCRLGVNARLLRPHSPSDIRLPGGLILLLLSTRPIAPGRSASVERLRSCDSASSSPSRGRRSWS